MSRESDPRRRLNWGCGEHTGPAGSTPTSRRTPASTSVGDIRRGLPLPDDSIDYAVSIHALPELAYRDLVPALEELLRVLKPRACCGSRFPTSTRRSRPTWRGTRTTSIDRPRGRRRAPVAARHPDPLVRLLPQPLYPRLRPELMQRAGFVDVGVCAPRETPAASQRSSRSTTARRRASSSRQGDPHAARNGCRGDTIVGLNDRQHRVTEVDATASSGGDLPPAIWTARGRRSLRGRRAPHRRLGRRQPLACEEEVEVVLRTRRRRPRPRRRCRVPASRRCTPEWPGPRRRAST